jgi:hypothetical protein
MKAHSVLLLAATLAGAVCCNRTVTATGTNGTQSLQSADSLHLAYGVQTSVPGTSLASTFSQLVQDSRCRADVVCVWAGELKVDVRVEQLAAASPTGLADTLHFSTVDGRTQVAFGYRFELIAARPTPRSNETSPPDSYWIALRVTAATD